ncbi:RNB domain-containing ribonuclease [Puniceicoccaceae bacterium K14]|nr:RNB domain-containing ribonuclease [Puniceicoccaceae bacterium K14]
MKIRDTLVKAINEKSYTPLDKQGLFELLELTKKERRKLDYELRLLASQGEIVRLPGNRYGPGKKASDSKIQGKINFRQNGKAIVIPVRADDGKAVEAIEVDAPNTGVAMHGDIVEIEVEERTQKANTPWEKAMRKNSSNARPQAHVSAIVKRARETIVGHLAKSRFSYHVTPDDPRIVQDIIVPDPKTCDIQPIPQEGSKVVVKLEKWEHPGKKPQGKIILNLGRTHEPHAELMAIFHKYNLNPAFPKEVVEEAKAIPETVQEEHLENREDLRLRFTFTIDPDDAKDFDDALSIENFSDGLTRIGIHIADVCAYVFPGTALDKEAKERGNSTYLVGKVVPMLPYELSNGICSLKENVDRLTKSVFITFDKKAKIEDVEFANTVIRSNKRLTYKQAYCMLKENDLQAARDLPLPPAHQTGSTGRSLKELSDEELSNLQSGVRQLWSIASKLRKERMKKGSLDLDISETKIFVDEDGFADRLEKIENDESHQLIEEFMLLANEMVARETRRSMIPNVYRVHEDPDEEKLGELRQYLGTYGIETADLTLKKELKNAITSIEKHPQGHILKSQLLRSLKKAKYSSSPDGHYGLSKENYCHFTSPIRRYSDLIAHRVFNTYLTRIKGKPPLKGKTVNYSAADVAVIAEHLSTTEVNSSEAERDSVKVKILEFFERELAKSKPTKFAAAITEVRTHGMFIELVESNAFGMVHVSNMPGDRYKPNPSGTAMIGRRSKTNYAVGQIIDVYVDKVDRFKRQVDFKLKR